VGDRYKLWLSGNLVLYVTCVYPGNKTLVEERKWWKGKGKSQPIFDDSSKTTLNTQHALGKPPLAVCLSVRNDLDFERCGLLEFYAASSGNSLTIFRDDLIGPILKAKEVFLDT